MIRSSLRAALAALLLLPAIAGCGSRSATVAKVADHTLTVDDFARAARGNESNVPGAPDQAKAALLRELVDRELFVVAAQHRGDDTTAMTRHFKESTENKLLMQALYAQYAPADLAASEGEARALYAQRSQQASVHLIYCTDEGMARQAAVRLAAGEPFAEVATRYSEPNVLPPGGDLGLRSPGDLFAPLDDAMLTLPLGKVGGPWQTPQGWFLMQVSARVPAPQAPFEQARTSLMEMLRQRKQRQAISNGLLSIEHANHLEVTTEGPAMLFRMLAPSRDVAAPHWMPDAKEQKLALATYDGGAYTMGDAMQELLNPGDTRGPDASSIGSVRSWIMGQAVSRIVLREARRRHLDQEPALAGQVHETLWNQLAQGAVLGAMAILPPPDPAAARAMWEGAKNQYPQLKSARLEWVATTDTAKANAITNASGRGTPLREAARRIDPTLVVHDDDVRFPTQAQPWTNMASDLMQMPVGAVSMPLFTGTDWRVVQLVDRQQGPVDWEQLTPQQQQQISRSVTDRVQQARYNAYKDSLWKAINPVLSPENLRRVPWPSAAAPFAGQ